MSSLDVDIRWKHRFVNFKKALAQLEDAVSLSKRNRSVPLIWTPRLLQAKFYIIDANNREQDCSHIFGL